MEFEAINLHNDTNWFWFELRIARNRALEDKHSVT